MRISFLLSSLRLSGGVRVVIEYANRLQARGHRVALIAPGGTHDADMVSELAPDVARIEAGKAPNGRPSWFEMLALTRDLARSVPVCDILLSTHTPTTVAGYLARRRLRTSRLAWLYQDYREMFAGRPIEDWLLRNALRWHEQAFVVSEYSRQELLAFVPQGRVRIVGEGLSQAELFRPLAAGRRKPRPDGLRRLLFLGDLRPRKGFFDFLAAAQQVYVRREDIFLQVVTKERAEFSIDLPHEVLYRPSRRALAGLYANCDVFVSASWWESFGLPPLEAMACGAPVVTTDSRGVREYARPGENCLMVPPRDSQQLAAAILQVLGDADLEERLRRTGPATAARITWEAAADRLEAGLRALLPAEL